MLRYVAEEDAMAHTVVTISGDLQLERIHEDLYVLTVSGTRKELSRNELAELMSYASVLINWSAANNWGADK